MDYMEEVRVMKQLMVEAAALHIMPLLGKLQRSDAQYKPDDKSSYVEPVTVADTDASTYILDRIRPKFPGSYSEEDLTDDFLDHDVLWQIDPLDGTSEFIEHVPMGSAMHAALLKRQDDNSYRPVAGLLYVFESGEMFYAAGRTGVVYEVDGIEKKLSSPVHDKVLGTQRKVDPNPELDEYYQNLGRRLGLPVDISNEGGAGATIAKLVKGNRNVHIINYAYTKEWDLSMAEPLIMALRGKISDIHGNPITYNRKDHFNRKGYVVSVGLDHDELIKTIREFEKRKPFIVDRDR